MFSLQGKQIAVVGAASGIGEAVADACADQGAQVACLDVDPDRAGVVAGRIVARGGQAWAGHIDVTDSGSVDQALRRIADEYGSLDGVVSTPGINVRKPLGKYLDHEFERVVRVNLGGTFHVVRAAGRIMTARRQGSIVVFSSIRSQVVEAGQGVYAATKAGIVQLARAAAAELGAAGVRVNAVAPGVVETPLTAPIKADARWYEAYASKNALGRWAQPPEIAWPTVFLLSDAASYVTGSLLVVDGGWLAIDGRFSPPGMD